MAKVNFDVDKIKRAIKENPLLATGFLKAFVKALKATGVDCYLEPRKQGKKHAVAFYMNRERVAESGFYEKEREAHADLLIQLLDQLAD